MGVVFQKEIEQKNRYGQHGPICNNCGGFGYTLKLEGGGKLPCLNCDQTGIAQTDLRNDVARLQAEIQGLKNIIIKELKGKI